MGTNIILCGLSGSGKTTTAKRLVENGFRLVSSSDDLIGQLKGICPLIFGRPIQQEGLRASMAHGVSKLLQLWSIGINAQKGGLVIDACSISGIVRFMTHALLEFSDSLTVHVQCPLDILEARLRRRQNQDGWLRNYRIQQRHFRPPVGENVITYDTHQEDFSVLMEKIKQHTSVTHP